ncbi:Mobile element protein (plasmid) [Rhodococcus sp. WAY2]|nr:Mobile element protein [Rhodococcus sp. WAY2]
MEDQTGRPRRAHLADEHRLPPSPRGTSEWNQIEHRWCSRISMNWRGRPLTSHEVIATTTPDWL